MSEQDEPLAYNPLAWLTGEPPASADAAPQPAALAGAEAEAAAVAPSVPARAEAESPQTPPRETGTAGACRLAPELTLATLSATARQLTDYLALATGERVDGSAVERIDFSGLQLLAAGFISARQRGQPLRLAAASPVLARAVETAGLRAVFEC